jgi:sulfur carrier protein
MNVTINGKPERVGEITTIADLVAGMGKDPAGKGLAVALNGEVVPRRTWAQRAIADDDRIELLEAVQGG